MLELAEKIGLSSDLIEKLRDIVLNKENEITSTAEKCLNNGFQFLKGKSHLFCLAVVLYLAVKVKEKYNESGIDDKIYYDTMSDIKIWSEKNGNNGLKNYNWLKNHVKFELFRLGRLQFQLYECNNRTLLYKKLPFDYGEKLIYVHIPEGEKLEKEKCSESFRLAESFFAKAFPEYHYGYYFCESWLLYEGNREFMKKDCNIVSFMSEFKICYSVKIDQQAIERIYGKRCFFKCNYPENTSLQKSAKAYMKKGNRLGVGVGVIKRSDMQ